MRKVLILLLISCILLLASCSEIVTDFDGCIAAGNPAIESYPRKCRHGDQTFTEKIGNVGETCSINEDCQTPMEFMVQSNCPFGSACIDSRCKVVCPLSFHDPSPEISKSYPYTCEINSECDCSERGNRTLECRCVDGTCLSVEAR